MVDRAEGKAMRILRVVVVWIIWRESSRLEYWLQARNQRLRQWLQARGTGIES